MFVAHTNAAFVFLGAHVVAVQCVTLRILKYNFLSSHHVLVLFSAQHGRAVALLVIVSQSALALVFNHISPLCVRVGGIISMHIEVQLAHLALIIWNAREWFVNDNRLL